MKYQVWNRIVKLIVLIGFLLVSSACGNTGIIEPSLTPTFKPKLGTLLLPYQTLTPGITETTIPITIILPETPAPTPTPFIHKIVEDDTMLGIAAQYGVTLEELRAANPGVDPRLLSVGMTLTVPLSNDYPVILLTATPMPVIVHEPVCYKTGDGGAWCLMAVENSLTTGVENLSAWISIYNIDGELLSGQVAVPPVNLLGAGKKTALMTYFPAPFPTSFVVRGEIITALGLPPEDDRYLDHQLIIEQVVISENGLQATIKGSITFTEDGALPRMIWFAAIAYNAQGEVVGVRKREAAFAPVDGIPEATRTPGISGEGELIPQRTIPFEIVVYSLGAEIANVEINSEVRP